jgi:hypothetical protein
MVYTTSLPEVHSQDSSASEVMQRRTDNIDQFVILATIGVAFVSSCF